MINFYINRTDGTILHERYVRVLIKAYRQVLKNRKNVHHVQTKGKPLSVVGDIHGTLSNLKLALEVGGHPKDTVYVINGDYVDRGKYGIEVLIVLLCYGCLYPDTFILNRGNHEDPGVTSSYGFSKEVQNKYKSNSESKGSLINLITDVFRWLPLAIVVDKSILIVHGGISKEFNLNTLNKIDRKAFPSVLVPPELPEVYDNMLKYFMTMSHDELLTFEKETGSPLPEKIWHWRYLMILLWSDPQLAHGFEVNASRGGGGLFGPDITDYFLQKHNLKLLIRSHQCKPLGYEILHDRKCITIFSASNYYDKGSNKGAVVKFYPVLSKESQLEEAMSRSQESLTDKKLKKKYNKVDTYSNSSHHNNQNKKLQSLNLANEYKIIDYTRPKIVTFQVDLDALMNVKMTELVKNRHFHAMIALRQKMIMNMAKITQKLKPFEFKNGIIKLDDWAKIVHECLHVELPWMLMRRDLPVVVNTDNNSGLCVNYLTTFEKMKQAAIVDEKSKCKKNKNKCMNEIELTEEKVKQSSDLEYKNQTELIRLFDMIDSDKSGNIDSKELVLACKSLPFLKGTDVDKIATMMDFDKDGKIDLNEFMEAFRLVLSGRTS